MNPAVTVSGVRPPLGRYMGGLKTVEAFDLAAPYLETICGGGGLGIAAVLERK